MRKLPIWPRQGGSSLILVLLEPGEMDLSELSSEFARITAEFGVEVGHGVDRCTDLVRAGLTSLPWLGPASVFVFRCPRELPIWEAAPLLELGLGSMSSELIAAGTRLLKRCAEAALRRSPRIAFVAAHEWEDGDSVRFESGSLEDFLEFIATPGAWSTDFLGSGNAYVVNSNNEFPFWYEVRRQD